MTACAKQPPPLRGLKELGPGLAGDGEGPALTDDAQVMASGLPMRWCRSVPGGEDGEVFAVAAVHVVSCLLSEPLSAFHFVSI